MMNSVVTTFATLYLASQLVTAVPYPQQAVDPATQASLDQARAAALPLICSSNAAAGPEPLPEYIFTDFRDKRRDGNTSFGIPDPQVYRYVAIPLRQESRVIKDYLKLLVNLWDSVAQSHRYGEPIPDAGFVIQPEFEALELNIIQEGDRNLVWGNVQGALTEMKKYYQDTPDDPAFRLEVIIQYNYFLEGYARTQGRKSACPPPSGTAKSPPARER